MSKKSVIRPNPEDLKLPLIGADSHAHLVFPELFIRLPEVIKRANSSGVAFLGNVFLSIQEYQEYSEVLKTIPGIFFLLGIHPCDAMKFNKNILKIMYDIFYFDEQLKAVGEIGLDFYHKDCTATLQEEVFRSQINFAREMRRPIVIHSRDAARDTIRILESEECIAYPILWHCFSGDAVPFLDRILSNGWNISIAGPVTYPGNKELQEVIPMIPEDKLLLETDCPYLSPVPWRGKCNEPALVVFTAAYIASLKEIDIIELWKQCGENTKKFFMLS